MNVVNEKQYQRWLKKREEVVNFLTGQFMKEGDNRYIYHGKDVRKTIKEGLEEMERISDMYEDVIIKAIEDSGFLEEYKHHINETDVILNFLTDKLVIETDGKIHTRTLKIIIRKIMSDIIESDKGTR